MMRGHALKLCLIVCAVAAFLFCAKSSSADSSYDIITFRPPAVGSSYFGLFGSRPLGHMQYSFGLDTSYSYKPLDYVDVRGNKSDVIRQLVTVQAGGGLGLWNRFDFGVSFPAGYESITPIGQTKKQSRFRTGDAELEMRVGLLNVDRYPMGLSLVPFITFPTGSTSSYLGDGIVTGGALVAVEGELLEKKLGLLLNLGYRFRSKTVKDDVNVDDQFLYGLGVHYRIIPQIDLIAEAQGAATATNLFKQTRQTPVIARGGFRYIPKPKVVPISAYAGGGGGVIAGLGSPKAQVIAGGRYTGTAGLYLSKKAEEKTAIYNLAANCMGKSMDMSGECFSYFELKEREAECSGIVEEMTVRMKDSCLSVWELKDAEKEIGSVVDLAMNCATGTAPDRDCMAYYNLEVKAQKCPADFASFDPWQHDPSCLKMMAVRGKGVAAPPLAVSAAAPEAERIAAAREDAQKVAASQIAAARAEAVTATRAGGPVSLDVHFKIASVLVEREYLGNLIDLAKFIKSHPEMGKIMIEGHADDIGAKNYNDRLSLRRADAVKRYLVKIGVPAGMLETAGYGSSMPAVQGTTPEARAANRRVEFKAVNP